ncbi:transcription elongation factor, partial [Cystoisospora suis]
MIASEHRTAAGPAVSSSAGDSPNSFEGCAGVSSDSGCPMNGLRGTSGNLPHSAAARSAALATCSALERVERILELKKTIDKARNSVDGNADGAPAVGASISVEVVESAVEALTVLDNVVMTRELLSKTRVGVSVGKLRSHPHPVIRSRCTHLVQKWKAVIGGPSTQKDGSMRPGCNSHSPVDRSAREAAKKQTNSPNAAAGSQEVRDPKSASRSPASDKTGTTAAEDYPGPLSGDAVRDRARGFLWRALVDGMQPKSAASSGSSAETARLASQIEKALWQEYCVNRKSTKEYNMQLKTLKWNFADQKNPDLNLKVICGVYTPEQLAVMTSAELASDEKKRMREMQKKESMEACQSDWEMKKLLETNSEGGQFPCFKCRTTKTV